jgi:uncharacterized membrane protein
MAAKSIFQSRTFWLGAAQMLVGVGMYFFGTADVVSAAPDEAALALAIFGALGIYLRTKTDTPVKVLP